MRFLKLNSSMSRQQVIDVVKKQFNGSYAYEICLNCGKFLAGYKDDDTIGEVEDAVIRDCCQACKGTACIPREVLSKSGKGTQESGSLSDSETSEEENQARQFAEAVEELIDAKIAQFIFDNQRDIYKGRFVTSRSTQFRRQDSAKMRICHELEQLWKAVVSQNGVTEAK